MQKVNDYGTEIPMIWALFMIFFCGLLAFYNWRLGLLGCVGVGFVQDPVRKLVTGQPGLLLITVAMAFAVVYLVVLTKRVPLRLSYVYGRDWRLKVAWLTFIGLVLFQCGVSLIRFGNPLVPVLGIATYLSPLAAMLIGFVYGRSEQDIRKFLTLYLLVAVPFALSVYLSYWFDNRWDILKDIGEFSGKGLLIYDVGTVLDSYSGLCRVGEIAAWHAAMASIILIVFVTLQTSTLKRILGGVLIALLIGAIVLTGRRKMLMALTVFIGVYGFILAYYWHGIKNVAVVMLVIATGVSVLLFLQDDPASRQSLYLMRSLNVYKSATERLLTSWDLFLSAIGRAGIFGFGAGISAQGAQYFGVDSSVVGGSTEAGIGKIAAELGVHGLLISTWLLFRIIKYVARMFRYTSRRYYSLTVLMAAIMAAMVANGATFFVATQLYGDMFILLLLGLLAGFLFAAGNIANLYARYEAYRAWQRQNPAPATP